MSAEFDATEFVDTDFQAHKSLTSTTPGPVVNAPARAPSRTEVETQITDAQKQLAEIERIQAEVQRKRDALAEVRRRQIEFEKGRPEMIAHLTRGLGLLEKAEFAARREAEQMAKTLADFREALSRLQAIDAASWRPESFELELTRSLTTIENARMEWNSARLKFPVLDGESRSPGAETPAAANLPALAHLKLGALCKLGLALTWPVAAVGLLGLGALMLILWRLR